jgi:hypothetical protein
MAKQNTNYQQPRVPVVTSTRPQQQRTDLGKPVMAPFGDQTNAKIVTPRRPT